MKVLVTSSRMPFAIDLIRKLGKRGHEVYATDTFGTAPGSHSSYVTESFLTASPRYETARFISQVKEIIEDRAITLVLPAFEEALYLSRHLDELAQLTDVFVSPFETLLQLHDKGRFQALAQQLGIRTPSTTLALDRHELREASRALGAFLARPAFSRGGVDVYTNTGPLAGALRLEDCRPTPENPWLVQEFVHGHEVCSFSVAHRGRIGAHAVYVHPREIEHAGGIVFDSVDEPETLEVAARIVEATEYTGQIHFDFMKTEGGLYLLECNPRTTAGIYMLDECAFEKALTDRHPIAPVVAKAGIQRKYSVALVRDMLMNWKDASTDLEHLMSSAKEVYAEAGDLLPGLFQLLSYWHVLAYRRRIGNGPQKRSVLMAAYFDDILYDGESEQAPHSVQTGAVEDTLQEAG